MYDDVTQVGEEDVLSLGVMGANSTVGEVKATGTHSEKPVP